MDETRLGIFCECACSAPTPKPIPQRRGLWYFRMKSPPGPSLPSSSPACSFATSCLVITSPTAMSRISRVA
eukprot:3771825-Prymnesium_polylepis.1